MTEQNSTPGGDSSTRKPAKRKRRGLWWKIPLVLLVVLLLLVLLAPTIASTSPVRSYVLSKINDGRPDKVQVADWSLGWFSGASAKGISYTDASGRKLVDVAGVTTPLTLMQLVRGNLHAGEIVIPEATVDAVVPASEPGAREPQSRPGDQSAPPENQPAKTTFEMPDTSATVRIEHLGGRITFLGPDGKSSTITLDKSSTLRAVLPPGGGPATVDANLVVVQPGNSGNIAVNATVNGLKPGTVDLTKLTGQAQVKIDSLDLDQVAGIARTQGTELAIKGLLSGQIDLNSPNPMEGTAKGELAATDVTAVLGQDQIVTKQLRIPINVALAGQGDAARLAISQLGVLLDQAQVNVTGDLPVAGLKQFQQGQQITQEGTAKVVAEAPDLATVMNSLRNTLKLQQGVQVSSGRLDLQANATLGKDGLRVQSPIALKDLAAVRDGNRIGPLQPFTVDAVATIPSAKAAAGDIRDVAVNIASSFLTLNAKGSTLATTNAQGECDLVKLRDDLGSIMDLSMIRGGRLTLNVVNRKAENDALESNIRVQLAGLGLDLPAAQAAAVTTAPTTQPSVSVAVAPPRRLEDANVLMTARTVLRDNVVTFTEPARIEANGRLLEVPAGQAPKVLVDQAAIVTAAGSYDSQQKKLHLTGLNVTAGKDKPLAQVALPEGSSADFVLAGSRGVTGAATLAVRADLAALQQIAQRYAGTAAAASSEGLRSGIFIGNVSAEISPAGELKVAVADSSLDFDYVVASKQYRDRLSLSAGANVSSDNSKIDASADAKGSTMNLATKATLGMATAPDGTRGLKEVRVDQLNGKTDFAEVSLAQPVVVSDVPALQAAMKGQEVPAGAQIGGELLVKADIAKVMALAGKNAPGAYGISGMLTARPKISLVQRAVVADFDSQVDNLRVSQGQKVVMEEPKLTVGGHVSVDPAAKVLAVDRTAISSASGLLDLKAGMRVSDLGANNNIENGRLEMTPDLGKVWPIVYAMLPPEKQTSIGELVATGRKTSNIVFSGSFPTNKPYAQVIKLVSASGDLPIENVNWKTRGITLSGTIPFALRDGIVRFASQTTTGPSAAQPLACNGGTVDISGATIDLTTTDPRLSITPKTTIAQGLQLNSVLVSSLGSYIAPVFQAVSGAVQGTADVVCDRCDRLPLGQLMFSPAPANDGVAQFTVNVHSLGVNSNSFAGMLAAVGGSGQSGQLAGDMAATVTLEKGRCLQKVSLPIGGTNVLPLEGDMRLSDNYYNFLKVALPRETAAPLLSKTAGLKLSPDDLPATLDLSFAGPANALKLNTDMTRVIASVTQQQLQKRVLGGLGGIGGLSQTAGGQQQGAQQQGGQQQPAATQPAAKQPDAVEAVEGLIDLFGKKKK